MTGQRAGAYGRRSGNVPPSVALPEHHVRYTVDEGWRVYAMTSNGVRFCPCKDNEAHARKVNSAWRSQGKRGLPDTTGGAIFVGGMILDPDGEVVERWGDGCDLANPRWRGLARSHGWSACAGCAATLWPYRLVLDGRCRACVTADEVDDPRPTWPGEASAPPRRDWPKWITALI